MSIAKDSVVTFHYRLSTPAGELIEDSHGSDPMAYLHGYDNIIPGLEQAMAGREAGASFEVTVSPDLAYGPRHADGLQRIPMKAVMTKGKLKPGMTIAVNTEQGPRHVRVVKPGRFVVDVDANHPLAGETLVFAIDVVEVREASAEELAHGHVHGVGGHAH